MRSFDGCWRRVRDGERYIGRVWDDERHIGRLYGIGGEAGRGRRREGGHMRGDVDVLELVVSISVALHLHKKLTLLVRNDENS